MSGSYPENSRPLYFFGCDMGGWHTDHGDALAICKLQGRQLTHVFAQHGNFFSSLQENGALAEQLSLAKDEKARIIVAIDAALAWPVKFAQLVSRAPYADHIAEPPPENAIDNPYLYRETERFTKNYVFSSSRKLPLTAPGDKFGNNSSKAQSLVAWCSGRLENCARPPFTGLQHDIGKDNYIIEVYPAASSISVEFGNLKWPSNQEAMNHVGNDDIADAKRCAMTAVCFADTVGLIEPRNRYPHVYLPDDANEPEYSHENIGVEGWIYAPRIGNSKPKKSS